MIIGTSHDTTIPIIQITTTTTSNIMSVVIKKSDFAKQVITELDPSKLDQKKAESLGMPDATVAATLLSCVAALSVDADERARLTELHGIAGVNHIPATDPPSLQLVMESVAALWPRAEEEMFDRVRQYKGHAFLTGLRLAIQTRTIITQLTVPALLLDEVPHKGLINLFFAIHNAGLMNSAEILHLVGILVSAGDLAEQAKYVTAIIMAERKAMEESVEEGKEGYRASVLTAAVHELALPDPSDAMTRTMTYIARGGGNSVITDLLMMASIVCDVVVAKPQAD